MRMCMCGGYNVGVCMCGNYSGREYTCGDHNACRCAHLGVTVRGMVHTGRSEVNLENMSFPSARWIAEMELKFSAWL